MTKFIQIEEKEVCFEYEEELKGCKPCFYSDSDGVQYDCGDVDSCIITVLDCEYTGDDCFEEITSDFVNKFEESFNYNNIKFIY